MRRRLLCFCLAALICFQFSVAYALEWISQTWEKTTEWVDQAARDTGEWVSQAVEDTGEWVSQAVQDTGDWAANAWNDTSEWAENTWNKTSEWASRTYEKSSAWVSGAWKDTAGWVSRAWEDSAAWVSRTWSDTSDWASARWDGLIGWVSSFTTENPYSWIDDVILDSGLYAYYDFADLRAFLQAEPGIEQIHDRFIERVSCLSLINEDQERLWQLCRKWAEEKGLPWETVSELLLPYVDRIVIKGSSAIGEGTVIFASVAAQYLIMSMESLEIESAETARQKLAALLSKLGGIEEPAISYEEQDIVEIYKKRGMREQQEAVIKYYSDASRCVASCFADGRYIYIDDAGKIIPIEVPADQIEAVLAYMKNRIINGEIPGAEYPEEAVYIVRMGKYTYQQAKHIAASHTVEGIAFDSTNACIVAGTGRSINNIIDHALQVWAERSIALSEDEIREFISGRVTGNPNEEDFAIDTFARDLIRGNVSWTQVAKKATDAVGIALDYAADKGLDSIPFLPDSVREFVAGHIAEPVADAVKDLIPDDREALIRTVEEVFPSVAGEYFLSRGETDSAIEILNCILTWTVLDNMHRSGDKEGLIRRIIELSIDPVVAVRTYIPLD